MIYYCADDYGLGSIPSGRIEKCIESGAVNKVSVFPNLDAVDIKSLMKDKNLLVSLHLNLVEGRCMADARKIGLLADEEGRFRHTFGGLIKLWLTHRKAFEAQLYTEIRAQVLHYKALLPDGAPFGIDSHQHTHMIPSVFKTLLRVLRDEGIDIGYLRIPAEPLLPFLQTPSLYFTYSAVNLIKQWLLGLLWLIDRKYLSGEKIPTAYFFGILFSGKMDADRVAKLLPKYIKLAEKRGRDIEILFHPGYLLPGEADFKDKNIVFEKFYLSENRKTEYDSVIKTAERSVL